jgi:hypothetical protein
MQILHIYEQYFYVEFQHKCNIVHSYFHCQYEACEVVVAKGCLEESQGLKVYYKLTIQSMVHMIHCS